VATRSETDEASLLADANRSLVRLAGRACQGGDVRPPATCAKVTAAALAEDDLPPLATFNLLALGAIVFLASSARAAWVTADKSRLPWAALAAAGAVVCAIALGR
jgi:hypothetical protein